MQRRRLSREFKLEAVKLVRERGVTAVQAARDLDLHVNVLRKWVVEARNVATALAQRGVKAGTVRGFGEAIPVADNATPEGQDKNRRVAVWISR